jgi:endonuclease/exonuclease/phosphatase family metal-dependent hydrolase
MHCKEHELFRKICVLHVFLALLILSISTLPAFGAPLSSVESWSQRFGGPAIHTNAPQAVAVAPNGNVIVTGHSWTNATTGYDFVTICYSSAGLPLWTNRYNGTGSAEDEAADVSTDSTGKVFVTGRSWGSASFDFATVAYSSTGTPLWTNRYNGAANSYDYPYEIAVDGAGNVYVGGTSSGGNGDLLVIKYSNSGSTLWTTRWNGGSTDSGYAMALDSNSNAYITGRTYNGANYDYVTLKLSSAGAILWTNRYNGTANAEDFSSDVTVNSNGDILITGSSYGTSSATDFATIAYSSAGSGLWTNRYNTVNGANDDARSVATDASGNVYVTGNMTLNSGFPNYIDYPKYATRAYSSGGIVLWTRVFGEFGPYQPVAIRVTTNGYSFVTGLEGSGAGADISTIGYAPDGVPQWTNRFNGPADGMDEPLSKQSMALTSDGFVVTGRSDAGGGIFDYVTIKYSVGFAPEVITQPVNQTNLYGSTALLAATVTGTDPMTFQWRKNGTNLLDGGNITGATTPNLTLTNLRLGDAGVFDLLVTNLFGALTSAPVTLTVITQLVTVVDESFKVMAANLAGDPQVYEAPQLRILQGLKPDVVAIQEWNYGTPTLGTNTPVALLAMVTNTFGTNFGYYREPIPGVDDIPNGVISRYPIVASGWWDDGDAGITDRNFVWSQLDVAGTNDLYVVSVHLKASNTPTDVNRRAIQATNLVNLVASNFPANAWIVVAGDFNIFDPSEPAYQLLSNAFSDTPLPSDAESGGDPDTNRNRNERYDYVFTSHNLQSLLVPTVLPSRSFTNGLVFDSRIYTPLAEVAPIQFYDSTNCQHMPVIKTLRVNYSTTNYSTQLPVIVSQPQSRTNVVGTVASFSVSAQGLPPMTYQWRQSGNAIPGANSNVFTIANVQGTNVGGYDVVVVSGDFSITSSVATLTVWYPPVIASQPSSQTNLLGSTVEFTIEAAGIATPINFQWRRNGTNFFNDGINYIGSLAPRANTLTLTNLQLADAGVYDVVVTNLHGSVTSLVAILTVVSAPEIVVQPASRTNVLGTVATFSVSASGTAPLDYQWRKAGAALLDQTNAALDLANVQIIDTGAYDVVINNPYGTTTSSVAMLTVINPPQITVQPQGQTVLLGASATFNVTATGQSPLAYQWRKEGVPIPGGTTNSLVISSAQTTNQGNYDVVITNIFGSTNSQIATLTLILATNGQPARAIRELPFDFHPGDLVEVRIQVTPPPGATNWSVQEFYPNRWDLVSATNAANSNEFTGELTFGPFTNDAPQTLFYELLTVPGNTNWGVFSGFVTFNNTTIPVVGTTQLPSRNEWIFVGPQSLTTEGPVSGTAYGAGRWVASSVGWTTTLENGNRWTYPRSIRRYGVGWSRLEHAGGLFFLFGVGAYPSYTQLSVSDDGLTWKRALPAPGSPADPFSADGGELKSFAYGNGAYVVVGQHEYVQEPGERMGAIFASTNGYNWSRVYRLPNQPTADAVRVINAVHFAEGRFMAVAHRGTLITSTNGFDWAEIQPIVSTNSSLTNVTLTGICHGPAGWIVTTETSSFVIRSPDGVNWYQLSASGSSGNWWHSFFADGKYWFSAEGGVRSTTDGTTWQSPQSLPGIQPYGVVSRGTAPDYLAGVGVTGGIVTSSNGLNWFLDMPNHITGWPRNVAATCLGGEWIISGQNCNRPGSDPRPTDRISSSGINIWVPNFTAGQVSIRDGTGEWRLGVQAVYADFHTTPNGLLAVRGARNQLVAGYLTPPSFDYQGGTVALPSLFRTVQAQPYKGVSGQTWEWVHASLTKTADGFDLFAETYTYVGARIDWGHFTSTNGSNWVLRTTGLNHATNFPAIRGIAWGANRFVAVSEGVSPGPSTPIISSNRIYTCTDGENYTALSPAGITPPLNAEGLTGVAFANGRFVAIGNLGRILTSTNGIDWQTVRASDNRRWNRIRYLGGTWAAVGNAGWVAFSSDGVNWTSKTAGAESDLTDIAYRDGQFMVVGSHAMVLMTQNVAPPVILTDTIIKQSGAGLQFNVSGQPGKVIEIQSSPDLSNWLGVYVTTNATGTVNFSDSQTNQPKRFYRALQLP